MIARALSVVASVVLAVGAISCESCGSEAPPATAPRLPPPARDAAAIAADAGSAAELPAEPMASFLDAPGDALAGLYAGLAATDASAAPPAGRALLLFFGDSHTAGDSLTSRLRITLQARFGDGGRGLVAAGRPLAKHYYQRDVKYGASGAWKAAVGGKHGDTEPFGIGGLRVFGSSKGAQLWVETCADCQAGQRVAQYEILYYAAPDHGILRYRVDDQPWQQLATRTTAIEPPHPARAVVAVADGPHRLTLEHGGGGLVELFGVALERARAGVIVDSLGVVGRRLGSLRSWDWSVIGEQLAARDPRLVVLQYGTNEADDPDLNLDDLARYYDDTILRIRSAAPTASILILGPPDLGKREAGAGCDHLRPRPAPVGGGSAAPIPECEWRTPEILGRIIAVEHAAAVRDHVAFFDTFAAMGGADQMHAWVTSDPKVAYKDHVHFTDIGYQRWADALSSSLLAGYARYRRTHQLPPVTARAAAPPPRPTDAPLPGPIAP